VGIYDAYYNCRCEPFSLSPDPRFLYLSPSHREALAQLLYVVEERKGFAVLTGEVGLGKTILLRSLVERVQAKALTAYVFNPPRLVPELYAAIWLAMREANPLAAEDPIVLCSRAEAISLEAHHVCRCPPEHGEHGALGCSRCKCDVRPQTAPAIEAESAPKSDGVVSPVIEVNRLLLATFRSGSKVVLIFDEAQCLTVETLEEIRLLSNLETPNAKFLQVILAGQPELDTLLDSVELRALRQRVVMRHSLSPLALEDTVRYIANRVRVAGAERSPFALDACHSIHHFSGGVPRLINLICDNAMLSGYAADSPQVDRRRVETVARELGLDTGPVTVASRNPRMESKGQPQVKLSRRFGRALLAAGLGALIVVLAAVGVLACRIYLTNNVTPRHLQNPAARARQTSFSRPWNNRSLPGRLQPSYSLEFEAI
jgi:general secretion pathway protein A